MIIIIICQPLQPTELVHLCRLEISTIMLLLSLLLLFISIIIIIIIVTIYTTTSIIAQIKITLCKKVTSHYHTYNQQSYPVIFRVKQQHYFNMLLLMPN